MRKNRSEPRHGQSGNVGAARYVAWFQGTYYAIAGIWPILDIDSFMLVTGPKTDIWLVHTVGLLLAAVGVVLCLAAYRKMFAAEVIVLAAGTALALIAIEAVYVADGTISAIYLLDAAVEIVLAAGWLWLGLSCRRAAEGKNNSTIGP